MPAVDGSREDLEASLRSLCTAGRYDEATERALRGYGPEVFGFLVGALRTEMDAHDAFSALSDVLWRKLPSFKWESTLRTWLYAAARRVGSSHHRDAARRRRREEAGSDSQLNAVVAAVPTETLRYLRTERRTRLQELRDELPEEDRMLLILRVDRGLGWTELARVTAGTSDDAEPDGEAIARESARLRKRFQLIKERLRETARREGLIE
jgi:RNA polymerase sigma-70 factor (ECF subfamily)